MKGSLKDWAYFGGDKVFDDLRDADVQDYPDENLFYDYLKESFAQNWFSNDGPCVKKLEKALAEFHQTRHCLVFCNHFTGSYLALPGKTDVLLPAVSYPGLCDIVRWAGYTPRFCPVEKENVAISSRLAVELVNENTALILAPHPVVDLCDIEGLERLAAKRGVPLFFDSSEACGAVYKGKPLGSFGSAEMFSLRSPAPINGAAGGYLTTDDSDLVAVLRDARAFGFRGADNILRLGTNGKLNELHAALALSALDNFEERLEAKKKAHRVYEECFADVSGVKIALYEGRERRNWNSLLLRLENDWLLSLEQTLTLLRAENVAARPAYAAFRGAGDSSFQDESSLARTHVLLPFGAAVAEKDVYALSRLFKDAGAQATALKERLA